jgi:hypothetical protein
VLRRFSGVDLGRAPAPDETTILNFRHLLEAHDLGGAMLEAVNRHLEAKGLRISTGTGVADMHMLPDLLHGEERKVWGGGGYQAHLRFREGEIPGDTQEP